MVIIIVLHVSWQVIDQYTNLGRDWVSITTVGHPLKGHPDPLWNKPLVNYLGPDMPSYNSIQTWVQPVVVLSNEMQNYPFYCLGSDLTKKSFPDLPHAQRTFNIMMLSWWQSVRSSVESVLYPPSHEPFTCDVRIHYAMRSAINVFSSPYHTTFLLWNSGLLTWHIGHVLIFNIITCLYFTSVSFSGSYLSILKIYLRRGWCHAWSRVDLRLFFRTFTTNT